MTVTQTNLSRHKDFQVAGIARRLAAMVYDSFLLFAIWVVVGALVISPIRFFLYGIPDADDSWTGFPFMAQIFLTFLLLMTLASYFLICWRKKGQSLGMKVWRLKLQQPNGELARVEQCLMRSLLAPISLGFFGIGYLWCLIPSYRECLHDYLTGTQVILLPKDK